MQTRIIKRESNSLMWKYTESDLISESFTVNLQPFNISFFLTKLLLFQCGLFKNNGDRTKNTYIV